MIKDSFKLIRTNFSLLEKHKVEQRKLNPLMLILIIYSILIMIPYEMSHSYKWLKIFGALNLMCDFIFTILLFNLYKLHKQQKLSRFILITDICAAIPGIAATLLMLYSLITNNFNFYEFIASAGLSIPALKTTKFLRILRVTRLFRIIRNVKLLKFISLKSDSLSAETAVGWIGFSVLILFIFANFIFVLTGPLATIESDYYKKLNLFKNKFISYQTLNIENIKKISNNFFKKIIVIKNTKKIILPNYNKNYIENNFCSLNSTTIKFKTLDNEIWEITFYDDEIFKLRKKNNLLWISTIIIGILFFSIITTLLIGRFFTDNINDYRKEIIDSYVGAETDFILDMENLSKNDSDSFAFAIGVYTKDFCSLINENNKSNDIIKEMENEINSSNEYSEELEQEIIKLVDDNKNCSQDLKQTIKLLKKIIEKNEPLKNKVKSILKLKTVKF